MADPDAPAGGWPVEPAPTPWGFPHPAADGGADDDPDDDGGDDGDDDDGGDDDAGDDGDDLVALGADLEAGTVLAAYRRGLFPMPSGGRRDPVGWWSPVRRGVLELDGLVVSRSLRRSCRDFEIRVDTVFDAVIDACADPRRPQGWIDGRIRVAYRRLHDLGWAHSVEAWHDGELAGGLYGVAIGGLFAGESMFHRVRDASKVALVGLVELLRDDHAAQRLIDVQWSTPHLANLGVVELDRAAYLARLPALADVPLPQPWRSPRGPQA